MSAKNVILITGSDLADAALGMLEDYELVFAGRQPTEAQLIALCQQHNPVAILVRYGHITAAVMDAAPALKVIAKHGSGIDVIDVEAAAARGILVRAATGANAAAVSEHTWALILACAKSVIPLDRRLREGHWDKSTHKSLELEGRTLGLIGLGAIGSRAPSFVSPGNLVEMFNDTAILIILALGQMMVLLAKGIDLSMAANLALTGMIVALLNAHNPGIPVVALLALATLLGLLMGMINGLLVWRLGIPAIVVTLGTMSIYRGIIFLLTDGGWVNSHQMSADFLSLPRSTLLGLPLLSWCAIAALLLVGYFLRYSRTGRALYTAGGNATAAYYTGINAGKMQFVSFCLSGALAGFCGYLWISRFAVAYVDVANGFELQVVAACVIGGISTMGGSGRVLGCLCGALFLGVINNALPVIGISPFWQMAISGAVIVMAVLLNERGKRGHGRLILRNAALARQKQGVKS